MKKIFKYSLIIPLFAALVSLTGCNEKELDVDPLSDGFTLSGIAPNPVMRGGELRIFGRGLDKVTEVRFAGDVTVTDFVSVAKGSKLDTLVVLVPMEGPEVGKVVIVNKDGSERTSLADLTFSEPIEVSSFSPATVLSGDVLTLKGEYLNDVREIIFSGDNAVATEFVSQSRHELKVKVPANAISGPVILSDVNEIEDENTIPNHIYTSDLTVGDPTVTKAAKTTYKSGDVITVKGAHLDMIQNVALPQVSSVDFTVAEDAASLKFNLSPKATDGMIVLTSYAGNNFEAGEIETVSVSELTVVSTAADGRFKAGCTVEITGTDLDLVNKVEFPNAAADWYLSSGKIIATQPATAKDGAIVVTLESGKQAYSDDIEVVKPVATAVDATEAVAGKTVIKVSGTDLDLVASATIGTKAKSFIDCTFALEAGEANAEVLAVTIPEQAYSGPITLTAESGYETVTGNIDVTYDMAVSISFDAPSYGLGSNITVTGQNLLQIDQIYIKGKRVTSFAVRADDALSFGIPENIGPGVYRLGLLLMDGTELTWPIPFEITAPFTETFIWEGSEDLNSWGNQPYLGPDGGFAEAGLQIGDLVRIYFTTYADDWQFQIFGGHWEGMTFPELDGTNTVNAGNCDASNGYFSFEVTEDNFAILTGVGGWGGALLTQGQGVIITGLSMVHFGAAEKRTVIWEGNLAITWGAAVTELSWGGYDWSTVQPGTKIAVAYTIDSDSAVIRFGNGSWVSVPSLAGLAADGNIPIAGTTSYEFELTAADLDMLVGEGGLVICGDGFTITEVALVTMEGGGPQENIIWEGSEYINWTGMQTLAWGGYDWTTVSAGTILVAHFDLDATADYWQIRFGNGSWASLPSGVAIAGGEGNIALEPGMTSYELELTQDDVNMLVNDGGLVMTGANYTLTAIGLK